MYIRFVTDLIDRKSKQKLGVIRAAAYCKSNNQFTEDDNERLDELFGWFNDFLLVPYSFSEQNKSNAISWFKDRSEICIRKVRSICEILEKYGYSVEMLVSNNPGYIVYEDENQVTAIPFDDNDSFQFADLSLQ